MRRKIVACVLVVSLLFFIGCYGTGELTIDELKANDNRGDLTVYTKDSLTYEFSKGTYHILGDTLLGSGVRARTNLSSHDSLAASIALADFASLKSSGFDLVPTIVFGVLGGLVSFFVFLFIVVPKGT